MLMPKVLDAGSDGQIAEASKVGQWRRGDTEPSSQLQCPQPARLRRPTMPTYRRLLARLAQTSAAGPSSVDYQQAEALKRLAAAESYRAIARIFGVHHGTIARLER
jgi:hypothetical protein